MKITELKKEILERMEREDDLYFEVADLFTQVRLEKGWTEKELAERMGTKQEGISRWECGKSIPNVKNLQKLAEVSGHKLFIKFNQPKRITMKKEEIKICECGEPLIWTMCFDYNEYVCLMCGNTYGMCEANRTESTLELEIKLEIYSKLWKVLYGGGYYLPTSNFRLDKCNKCDNGEIHLNHLTEREKIGDKIAIAIFKTLTNQRE